MVYIKSLCAICLLLISHSLQATQMPPNYEVVTPYAWPEMNYEDSRGDAQSLNALTGNFVILTFWAPWCPSCVGEMPSLNQMSQYFNDRNLKVVMVARDAKGQFSPKDYFLKKGFYYLDLLLDMDGKSFDAVGVKGLPTTYIINPDGRVVGKLVGALKWDSRESLAFIEAHLDGRISYEVSWFTKIKNFFKSLFGY